MKTIGVFYGSSCGTTENIAQQIAKKLDIDITAVHNVAQSSLTDLAPYEVLLLGSSTCGSGDAQEDWDGFLSGMSKLDLSDKTIALFGCGDSSSFSDTFCGAIGVIYKELQGTKAKFIGSVDASGYTFDDSSACIADKFVGLPLDDINEDDQTPARIDSWIEILRKEGNL